MAREVPSGVKGVTTLVTREGNLKIFSWSAEVVFTADDLERLAKECRIGAREKGETESENILERMERRS